MLETVRRLRTQQQDMPAVLLRARLEGSLLLQLHTSVEGLTDLRVAWPTEEAVHAVAADVRLGGDLL